VKINVLGGGPGGLYAAILAKKADPSREVAVYERNAADSTFGWGVVFSDETLGNLRDADAPTYDAIRADFAYWDHIDSHTWSPEHRVIRSGGHGFCGIGRMRLLLLLQDRARELGVALHFGTEIADVSELRDCDLLIASDGINSLTRNTYEASFRPTIEDGDARFIWLGTHQTFEAFTFSFRENAHGLFQVHAYQFTGDTSTFIVECDQQTWRAAGLHEASEAESIAYCEEVFADELGGHPLLGNRSSWIHFRTIKCERWFHENVALMGDAAHTAHFSVGSGTKMAMEDAIDLVRALEGNASIEDALLAYQVQGQDRIGRTQKAASQSQTWFEETKRHLKLPPEQLYFSMLSRSRRITHENMRLRDAEYVEDADAWWSKAHGLEQTRAPCFTPLTLRGLTIPNRFVVSPMCQYSAKDGVPNDWHLVHLGSRAIGGAGLVFTEMTDVSAEGRISPGCAGIWNDEQAAAWTRVVDFVHANSASKIGMQLGHAGRKGSCAVPWEGGRELREGGWEVMGPSALRYDESHPVPREMTREDMVRVREEHVAAAKRAIACGFDLLEVHCAHGYLFSSFLSPLSNERSDEYGGSLEDRARYPLEVVDAVRQVWDGPLSVRISATDWAEGGFEIEQAVVLSGWLKARGVDVVDVSTGQTSSLARPVYGRAYQTPFSERIRNELGVPTIAVGNIYDHDRVNTILLAGRADLVALARAHLANPYLANHAAAELGFGGAVWPPQYLATGPLLPRMYPPVDDD